MVQATENTTEQEWKSLGGYVKHGEYDSIWDDMESENHSVRIIIHDEHYDVETAIESYCGHSRCFFSANRTEKITDPKDSKKYWACVDHAREANRAENEGVYWLTAEYFSGSEWTVIDSIGGFIGDDWKSSGYDEDLKRNAIEAYKHFTGC